MKTKYKGITVLILVAVFGITAVAFAGWGKGSRRAMVAGGCDQGFNQRGGYGYVTCSSYPAELSQEKRFELDKQRADFLESTQGIREKLYNKNLELRLELTKEYPDADRSANIQTEISKLRSELDQKRLEHKIRMRKISPESGFGKGAYRQKRGFGNRGGGYCWR